MKRALCIFMAIFAVFVLTGCCIFSHQWEEATCTTPKTCAKCGKTEGDPLGHEWVDATCTEPKTCSVCGETEGDPLGHKWADATCTEPKTCSVCGETEGDPLGHEWIDATCTEPKTCSRCGETEGEPLGHEWVGATCTEPKTCSRCGETEGDPLGHKWVDATCTEPKTCSVCGETEGKPLGHEWLDATCTEPKTCSVCGEAEGKPLGHEWADATCTEPKTCSVCGETEGEPLGHEWADATCTEPKTCSVCGATEGEPLGHTTSWEVEEIDNIKAVQTMDLVCSVCGESLDSKEEAIETFIDGKYFTFSAEEFVERLQNAWDKQRKDDLEIYFVYSVNEYGNINFDIYNANGVWLGWGMFYDEEGNGIGADRFDQSVSDITLFLGPIDGLEEDAMFYLLTEIVGPCSCAVDPSIKNGNMYETPIAKNLYAYGEKPLNGIYYSCGYDKDYEQFSLDLVIAQAVENSVDAEKTEVDAIKQAGVLTVALSPDFSPMEFVDSSKSGQDQYVGFDVSLAKYIADYLGVELEIQPMSFSACQDAVADDSVDMSISGYAWTETRAQNYELSDYYYAGDGPTEYVILIRSEDADKYDKAEDFDGVKVGAQNSSLQLQLVTEQIPNANLVTIDEIGVGVLELQCGNIEGLAVAGGNGDQIIANNPDLAVCSWQFDVKPEYEANVIVMRKGETALLAIVNEALENALKNNMYSQWYDEALSLADNSSAIEVSIED